MILSLHSGPEGLLGDSGIGHDLPSEFDQVLLSLTTIAQLTNMASYNFTHQPTLEALEGRGRFSSSAGPKETSSGVTTMPESVGRVFNSARQGHRTGQIFEDNSGRLRIRGCGSKPAFSAEGHELFASLRRNGTGVTLNSCQSSTASTTASNSPTASGSYMSPTSDLNGLGPYLFDPNNIF